MAADDKTPIPERATLRPGQHPQSQLDKFEYHPPTDRQIDRIKVVRQAFWDLEATLETNIPNCQERSVAITNLRTAMMWANAAIVFTDSPTP